MFAALHRFFVYSNLFIAACAALMVNQAFQLMLDRDTNTDLLGFVFFSTLASYSFHWYLTGKSVIMSPRVEWLQRNRNVHIVFFIIGMAGAGFFLYRLLPYALWLLVAAIVTFLYSAPKIPHRYFRALRKVAIGKTIFLALVWMYVTTILPAIVSEEEWTSKLLLFSISRFFLIYAICILFDYRDRADDKLAGIRSLITWLSEKNITRLFVLSLLIFAVATLSLLNTGISLVAVIFLLIPGILTGAIYNYALRRFDDMLYYFVLDGLMAFSALLTLIPGI